jgi:D-serine deaminase-like pyridoxal phosphate-dependent protein
MMPAIMRLDDLPTPSLILDRSRLERNVDRMRARAKVLGVTLRPHMKTAKSAHIAEMATGGHGPIAVSTLAEAAYFFARGFRDILYAVGIVPAKLAQAAALQRSGATLTLLTDDVRVAQIIAARGAELGVTFRALIEIDTGLGRAGIAPEASELLAIAGALTAPGAALAGVLTHAGHSYHCRGIGEIKRIAEEERAGAVLAAARLREAGFPCPVVSVGSTPTAIHADSLEGVTEMRPGNFVFFDLFQVGVGSCAMEDVAVSVLASITGHHRARQHFLIDAGALALSKDTGANEHRPGTGFGLICETVAKQPIDGLAVTDVHQEHGIVTGTSLSFERFPIGGRVRVLPNHSCMTAAMYDRYYVTDGGADIFGEWDRVNGW